MYAVYILFFWREYILFIMDLIPYSLWEGFGGLSIRLFDCFHRDTVCGGALLLSLDDNR